MIGIYCGAEERTRTSTRLPGLAPEASANIQVTIYFAMCYYDMTFHIGVNTGVILGLFVGWRGALVQGVRPAFFQGHHL